jgi:predicted regulator of Ras-like GTPase activity (Roadblock/LC7/MglB family)
MPFQRILGELLRSTDGALGAIFLDHEGESVALRAERIFEIGEYGLKAIGAYFGMFLSQARRLSANVEGGEPDRITISFEHAKILSCPLKDGYYLVLVMDAHANEGVAWQHLRQTRQTLIAEIG